jgi:hypothetical protein
MTDLYNEWIEYSQKHHGINNLTRNQWEFAEWCLNHTELHTMFGQIGDFEKVLVSIVDWTKYSKKKIKNNEHTSQRQ